MESSNERLLQCNLCNNRFQDIPYQLPCLHSFCESCLAQLLDSRANNPECSTSVLLAQSSESPESDSHEENGLDTPLESQDLEQEKPSSIIVSLENEAQTEIQDASFKTNHNSNIVTVGSNILRADELIATIGKNVNSKVIDTTDNSDSAVLQNDTSNVSNTSANEEINPATDTDIVKSVRICSFMTCPTCKFEVKLAPLDQSVLDKNQLETARRLVRARLPINYFLSHLISVNMRSTGKKDCETCKTRQKLSKDGKKKEKSVTADSMCVNCDQLMCHQCHVAHDGYRPFQSHKVIDVIYDESKRLFSLKFRRLNLQHSKEPDSVPSSAIQFEAKYECPIHSERFTLFCIQCKVPLCSQCMKTHFQHETSKDEICPAPILMSEAAKNEREQATILQTKLSERIQQKLEVINKLGDHIEKSSEIKVTSTNKIYSIVAQLKETIDSSLKEISENIGNILESKKTEFQRIIENSKRQEDILKDLSTYLSVALAEAPDEQIPTVVQDVNKAFAIVKRDESTDSDISDDILNYGHILSSLMEKCLADTLKKNNIDFKSDIEDDEKHSGLSDVIDRRPSKKLSSTVKRQSSHLLVKSGDLKHAFLGSVNEVWDNNVDVLLFDVVVLNGERIIISDFHNESIKEFDEEGHLLACCSVDGSPTGICVVSEHQVICALTWCKKLCFVMRDPRGNFLAASRTVSVEKQYCGIALTADHSLLCTCDKAIDLINFDGEILQTLSVFSGDHAPLMSPRHIIMLPDFEYFLVSDSELALLICCNIDGHVKFTYSGHAGQSLSKPSGLSIDKKGFIYMTDSNHNCIYRLTANGELDKVLFTEEEGIAKPKGIAISADGTRMYLTETDSGVVKVLEIN